MIQQTAFGRAESWTHDGKAENLESIRVQQRKEEKLESARLKYRSMRHSAGGILGLQDLSYLSEGVLSSFGAALLPSYEFFYGAPFGEKMG